MDIWYEQCFIEFVRDVRACVGAIKKLLKLNILKINWKRISAFDVQRSTFDVSVEKCGTRRASFVLLQRQDGENRGKKAEKSPSIRAAFSRFPQEMCVVFQLFNVCLFRQPRENLIYCLPPKSPKSIRYIVLCSIRSRSICVREKCTAYF